ncbi:hypothetical protein LOCC1_G007766 [Lachnellula occidentalis]|uniref:BTB domain-containing protein n=1 Tax=Lachnellula occidentalis TaxID=215460 RepID=A0A8H8UBU5_9HELO|nr:hypothetical protein LOCC1_G007766 [Lachnellula occidentalis]
MAPKTKDIAPSPLKRASLSSPKKKAPSFQGPAQLVTFKIGPDLTEFVVHKEFACHYSPVLKAAFESEFIEGQTQTYTLDDTTEGAFRMLVQWLYTQKVTSELRDDSSSKPCDGINDPKQREIAARDTEDLVTLWVLAGKLIMPTLQNEAMDVMMWYYTEFSFIRNSTFAAVYAQTAPDSLLRKAFVELCTHRLETEMIVKRQDSFPKEMLLDMFVAAVAKGNEPDRPIVASDYYVPVPL